MSDIKLDPKTLLGFKILSDGETVVALCSPKIGAKGAVSEQEQPVARKSPIAAKIGFKTT